MSEAIYILGLHRSGTTIWNLVLGAHPDCVAVGEVFNVIRPDVDRESIEARYSECTCGVCGFWPEVMGAIDQNNAQTLAQRYQVFVDVFRAHFPDKILVDSSKMPAAYAALTETCPVTPVHVIRDVRGWSVSRTGKVAVKSMLRWYRRNRDLEAQYPEAIRASYDALIFDTDGTIADVFGALGLSTAMSTSELDYGSSHILIGNRMRHDKQQSLIYDHRWMTDHSLWPSILVPIMRYNQYRVYGQ